MVFAIAAGLPWALLILLAAGLVYAGAARAEEPAVCDGVSLVGKLSATAPEKLASARDEAAATPNGQGRLWKIEKDGREPSWLFGTMHVTDPRVTRMPDAARTAFDTADTVVIETIDILDPVKAQAALLTNPELTMFTDGSTLTSRLSPEDASLVEAELSRRGIPLALVSRMKPWMIAGMVAMPACELARKADGVEFLDIKIASDAKAQGKQLLGLESIGEQMTAMADLPIEFHMRGLVETIKLADLMPDIMATMTELYLDGEIALIMPVILAAGPEDAGAVTGDDLDGYAEFEERIVTLRNHVMADRAGPILEKGNAFIAVGALHLPGEKGLVSLLSDAGYTVSPVR
ncbi:MAG: TraB/GumN family protein [Hoeflea sp.]|nr:TraB/GumN family protein [Alphaproteobacteria bacterium]MBV1722369.1 TraB/GumN family protein [Hoeflea sp.]MBU4547103.1 TraB/GumN family protein [Alphaproteobacteria bacterium]MBU4548716.1 TraB/GumN family protein [Alphaproteobacteria bacterium]MBV1762475.1 TraB/GumN family protein [Hoeflea sp.]